MIGCVGGFSTRPCEALDPLQMYLLDERVCAKLQAPSPS